MVNDYQKSINEQEKLILKIKALDVKSMDFRKVYHQHFSRVFYFVSQFLIHEEDIEEVVRKVFICLRDKRNNIISSKNISAVLFVIAKDKVMEKIRDFVIVETQED